MKTQIELGFERCPKTTAIAQRRRIPGARWWFQQMHTIVDQAVSWTPPKARPQQTYLSLGASKPFTRCAS